MLKFGEGPIAVEAIKFTLLNQDKIERFVGGDMGKDRKGNIAIATTEGPLEIFVNDWIVKNVHDGHFCSLNPHAFVRMYRAVTAITKSAGDHE